MAAMAKPWKHPKSGIYYLRLEVPISLRHVIGKREIKESLRTTSFSEAKTLFSQKYYDAQKLFSDARTSQTYTIKDVDILAHRWLIKTTDSFITEEDLNLWLLRYRSESRYGGYEEITEPAIEDYVEVLGDGFRAQLALVGPSVKQVMQDNTVFLEPGSELHRRLVERMVRMHIEVSRVAYKRYKGRWGAMHQSVLETAQGVLTGQPVVMSAKVEGVGTLSGGTSVASAIDLFTAYKIDCGDWDEKTQRDAEIVFGLLASFTEPHKLLDIVTRQQIRDFYGLLQKLPSNYSKRQKYEGKSLSDVLRIAAGDGQKPIAAATAKKKMLFVKSLFKFAHQEEWVTKNRAEGIKSSQLNDAKNREALTVSEIELVFDATSESSRPSDYWLPRISLSTGMRANEILQLTARDIKKVAGIYCFDINSEIDNETGKPKKVKRTNSLRKVPIPQVLINSGFIDFVEQCSSNRLFQCVTLGAAGSYTQQYSKRVNTLLHKLGVKPPANSSVKKDFHSFRHTFRANARQAGISKETADLIGGWSDQENASEGDNYGRSFELFMDQLKTGIDKIDYSEVSF